MRSIGLYLCIGSFLFGVALATLKPVGELVLAYLFLCSCAVLLASIRHSNQFGLYTALIFLMVSIGMARVSIVPTELPKTFQSLIDTPAMLSGTVVALPDIRESSTRLTIEITKDDTKTRIIAAVPPFPKVGVGDEVTVSGTLKLPEPFATDGGRTFAYDQFLRKDGVFALIQPANVAIIGRSNRVWLHVLRFLEYCKESFIEAESLALPEPESALAVGLVVGGKQGLGKKLIDAFTVAGMLQVVVLSGYNVMIVANGVLRSLTVLPKRLAGVLAIGSLVLFIVMAGASASALRAGLMAFFAVVSRVSGKEYEVLRILFISLFLLILWSPLSLIYDPGLQFSFLATLGLVVGTSVITPWFAFIRRTFVREMVVTTLAAQVGVLPLLLWQSGNLSFVALPANILVMPVIPAAMALSAIAALLAFPLNLFSTTVPVIVGLPAYILLSFVIHVATVSASLPFAQVVLPGFSFWVVGGMYLFLALVVVYTHNRRGKRFALPPPIPRTNHTHPAHS